MKKRLAISTLVATLTLAPIISPLAPSILNVEAISQQQQGQRLMSFGASLSGPQLDQTRELLGGSDVSASNIIYVDGTLINHYLRDGSNQNTIVYSSGLIIPQAEGHGVRVEVVTPQNILLVSPATYQNAAITAGARNVLIRIAAIEPVTGEGALAGIYALLEESGQELDPQSIEIAEKEIVIINEIEEEEPEVNVIDINHFITYVKQQVTIINVEGGEVNQDVVVQIVNNYINQYNIELSDEAIQKIIDFILEYAETDTAHDEDTIEQLEISLRGDWRTMLGELESEITPEEFATVERPDYSNTDIFHPIVESMIDALYASLETNPELAFTVYNDTFLVQAMMPELNADSSLALNHVRALSHQMLMAYFPEQSEEIHQRMINGVDYTSWLTQDRPEQYNQIMTIALQSRVAPQTYEYFYDESFSNEDYAFYDIFKFAEPQPPNQTNRLATFSYELASEAAFVERVSGENFTDYEINFPPIGLLTSDVDFESLYGVAIENNFVPLDIPEDIEEPEQPEESDDPELPEVPEQPEESDDPELPEEPEQPEESDDPELPEEPEQPEESDDPELPEDPEQPEESDDPELPEVTEQPEESDDPELPEEPEETGEPVEVGSPLWSNDQALALSDYMSTWSVSMNQMYQEYTPDLPTDFYGSTIPNDALEAFALNGTPMEAYWSPNGNYADVVNVVATFSDIEDWENPDPNRQLYFFTIMDGQPQVLVNQEGMSTDGIYNFVPTQNQELAAAFQAILNGEQPEYPEIEEESEELTWNTVKEQELEDFMLEFNQVMAQEHQAYSPENNTDYYGVPIFPDLIDLIAIDEMRVEAQWTNDQLESDILNIVAVYSNIDEERDDMVHYLYLFTVENGETEVYVTAQNQGQPDGLIHFAPSENQDLQNAFEEIMQGNNGLE